MKENFDSIKIPVEFVLELFIGLGLVGRLFSISSAYQFAGIDGKYSSDGDVELTIAIVEYQTSIRKLRRGICTRYIKALQKGDLIGVSLIKGNLKRKIKLLGKVDEPIPVPDATTSTTAIDFPLPPLIMIGPGTGIAPMKSIIEHTLRHWTDLPLSSARQLVLFTGNRKLKESFLYGNFFTDLERLGYLSLFASFSRDRDSDDSDLNKDFKSETSQIQSQKPKTARYVQDTLWLNKELVYDLIVNKNASVYLCGSAGKMPLAVKSKLVEILKNGSDDEDWAQNYVKKMEGSDSRLVLETCNHFLNMSAQVISTSELNELVIGGNQHMKIDDHQFATQIKPKSDVLSNIDLSVKFDPKIHLAFTKDCLKNYKRTTMEELGATCAEQISEIGVSEPFPLFTDEAIDIMRAEILRKEVFDFGGRLCFNSTTGLDCTLRGYAKTLAPFTYDAWTHPDTVAAISAMAGVELTPVLDYEVAHVNVAMKSEDSSVNENISSKRLQALNNKDADIPAVVGWHVDSYPFVCVLMLSDTSKMVGGETLIKTPSGDIVTAEGPAKGKATVLQGRILTHLAALPVGYTERITSVTAFRAKDPLVCDTSDLHTIKPELNYGTHYNEFYPQWVGYRMKIISGRALHIKQTFEQSLNKKEKFDKQKAFELLKDLENYLFHTWKQMEVSEEEWSYHKSRLRK
ncbi:unnamed protein product [Ambrosiozyma monospora]|uniref:Unnamed protein product n=1 Tax=Ambrosiozyma monospora TaxID=43982 RepID=A0ACB5STJ9_AMBMO|nr:unnamed protein product [Ambrosiozyma monospora]